MADAALTPAKRRVLDLLKRLGPTGAAELAGRLELTDVAVRQHLGVLETMGLVGSTTGAPPGAGAGRGRPSAAWSLTPLADELFPDRHADLTVSLIQATRECAGEAGLRKIIDVRAAEQIELYRRTLPPPTATLARRVQALARQRTAEGYMAEARREAGGRYLLIEHHCPICDAARTCQGLCAAELDVFRAYLGRKVDIERVSHVLADGDRCAYRITEAP